MEHEDVDIDSKDTCHSAATNSLAVQCSGEGSRLCASHPKGRLPSLVSIGEDHITHLFGQIKPHKGQPHIAKYIMN